jgi:hypothetical protein
MSISDSLPTHIVGLLLANGVIFENEENDKALQFLDILVWERGANNLLRDKQSSNLAAAVIHAARIEEFNTGRKKLELSPGVPQPLYTTNWPSELETLTQWQVKDLEDIA